MAMITQACFSNFFSHICQVLTREGIVEEISCEFSKITCDSERYKFVSNLMSKYELQPSCLDEKILSKCKNEAIRLRSVGNDTFIEGKSAKAHKLYCRSALFAPSNDELSMAFANRSAVLADLKLHRDAVSDIERALDLCYPDELKFKLIKRKAECLCQLGCHSEAQENFKYSIALIKKATILPEDKRTEIERKTEASFKECCSHGNIEEPDTQGKTSIPSLVFNEEVPCASQSVTISYNDSLGRHIVATKCIDPGEVVAVEESFSSILLPEFFLSHCYHCLRRCWAMIPCTSCCHVMFCGEECRTMSWNQYHEKECSILDYILSLDMGKMALLALRIVLLLGFSSLKDVMKSIDQNRYSKCLREKGFSENGKYVSSQYSAIYHLEGHSNKRYISDLFKRACMAYCLVRCLRKGTSFLSSKDDSPEVEMICGELILRHLQNLPCNAHEVSELLVEKSRANKSATSCNGSDPHLASSLTEIGAAAYAMLSLINHSCDPNVVRHSYKGSTAVLRAIRPIKVGEQVLDNYGYHYAVHSLKLRKDNLRDQYFFECMCTPCLEKWPTYQFLEECSLEKRFRCLHCLSGTLERVESLELAMVYQKSELLLCKKCGKLVDVTSTMKEVADSSEEFKSVLHKVLSGQEADKDRLIRHLILLDRTLVRPWKEYNDCQEALKHTFALEGNCFKI